MLEIVVPFFYAFFITLLIAHPFLNLQAADCEAKWGTLPPQKRPIQQPHLASFTLPNQRCGTDAPTFPHQRIMIPTAWAKRGTIISIAPISQHPTHPNSVSVFHVPAQSLFFDTDSILHLLANEISYVHLTLDVGKSDKKQQYPLALRLLNVRIELAFSCPHFYEEPFFNSFNLSFDQINHWPAIFKMFTQGILQSVTKYKKSDMDQQMFFKAPNFWQIFPDPSEGKKRETRSMVPTNVSAAFCTPPKVTLPKLGAKEHLSTLFFDLVKKTPLDGSLILGPGIFFLITVQKLQISAQFL